MCLLKPSYGQSGLREGFIINQKNDTVRGGIDFISVNRNYKTCRFKEKGEINKYTPSQIDGYGFTDGKLYSSQVQEGSFVEVLVRGELSLFKGDNVFYIQKGEGEIYKLESSVVYSVTDGKQIKTMDDSWKGVVTYLIGDCDTDLMALHNEKLSLEEKSLTKIVVDYNTCKESGFTTYNENRAPIKINFGIISGVTNSVISIPFWDYSLYKSDRYFAKEYKSLDMSNGLFVSLIMPEPVENMAIQAETHYIKSNYNSYIEIGDSYRTYFHDTHIMLKSLLIPLSLKYSLPERIFPVFFQAGYSFFWNLQSENIVVTDYERFGVITTSEYSPLDIVKIHSDIWGRIGFYKRFNHFEGAVALSYFRTNSPLGRHPTFYSYEVYIDRLMVSVILSTW